MITAEELKELDALEADEMDFYAPLMLLCLSRLQQHQIRFGHVEFAPLPKIREIVSGAYRDLNYRIALRDSQET